MSIKEKIYAICVENKLLKKIYTSISYVKWKIYYKKNLVNPINEYKKSTKNPIFLIFTPEHANLGDHAIAYAESILLKKARIKYYEITGEKLYELEQYGYLSHRIPILKFMCFRIVFFMEMMTMDEKSLSFQRKYITTIRTYIYVQEKEFLTIS